MTALGARGPAEVAGTRPWCSDSQPMQRTDYIFNLENVRKVYDRKEVLKGITLSFLPGAKIGVIGHNGAGKSTLMRIIAGEETDFEGVARPASGITVGYVSQREQFGAPIGTLPAVQHRSANMYIDLDALRWTTWRAAWMISDHQDASRQAAVAKIWASEAGRPLPS